MHHSHSPGNMPGLISQVIVNFSTEEVAASDPLPRFDYSAMDGYAIRAADTNGVREGSPVRLRVVGEARAGESWSGGRPSSSRMGRASCLKWPWGRIIHLRTASSAWMWRWTGSA